MVFICCNFAIIRINQERCNFQMKRRLLLGILGSFIGFVVGVIVGGYIGLVLGGTFLGSFEIYKSTGFEGYELSAYVGAIIGGIITLIWGIKLALKFSNLTKNKK